MGKQSRGNLFWATHSSIRIYFNPYNPQQKLLGRSLKFTFYFFQLFRIFPFLFVFFQAWSHREFCMLQVQSGPEPSAQLSPGTSYSLLPESHTVLVSIAAVTCYWKRSGFKQHRCVALQFCRSEVWNGSHWTKSRCWQPSFWSLWGRRASRGCLRFQLPEEPTVLGSELLPPSPSQATLGESSPDIMTLICSSTSFPRF